MKRNIRTIRRQTRDIIFFGKPHTHTHDTKKKKRKKNPPRAAPPGRHDPKTTHHRTATQNHQNTKNPRRPTTPPLSRLLARAPIITITISNFLFKIERNFTTHHRRWNFTNLIIKLNNSITLCLTSQFSRSYTVIKNEDQNDLSDRGGLHSEVETRHHESPSQPRSCTSPV
jgi:hypothetical protein